jgi:hypothetical protein
MSPQGPQSHLSSTTSCAPTAALDLEHAMQVTGVIRRIVRLQQVETMETAATATATATTTTASRISDSIPPGVIPGISVAVLTGTLFLPARRMALMAVGQQLRPLVDLMVTTGQLTCAAMAGLYATSLYGSRVYLQQLAHINPMALSAVADAVCRDDTVVPLLPHRDETKDSWSVDSSGNGYSAGTPSLSSSWDPRVQTMLALHQALQSCQQRQLYRSHKDGWLDSPE